MEKVSRETFIRLAAALGVGAASASLAACGGGSGSTSGGGSGSESNTGGSGGSSSKDAPSGSGEASDGGEAAAPSGGSAIAQESEVAPGSSVKFKDGGRDAVLIHLDSGDFVAYSAICTHAGCTVAYRNSQLACPCHGSIFDPANGAEVVSGPAQTPLPKIPVEVRNGEVLKA